MLKKITIKDFTIIRDLEIDFTKGFNIITGETGSGKSLIFEALNIALGVRASSDLVRRGQSKAIIESHFEIRNKDFLKSHSLSNEFFENSNQLIFRRELSKTGQSRAFLNDSQINTADVKRISSGLMDYHSQHAGRDLLDSDQHIHLIDLIAFKKEELSHFKVLYNDLKSMVEELNQTLRNEQEIKQKLDYWEFQLKEIMQVDPQAGEYEDLEKELSIIENAESIFQLCSQISDILYNSENSSYTSLSEALGALKQISALDNDFNEYKNELESTLNTISEVARFSSDYKDNVEFSPERIEEIRDRLISIRSLIKKYGSIEEVLSKKEEFSKNISLAGNFDKEIELLNKKIAAKSKELGENAIIISKKREEAGIKFAHALDAICADLGMEHTKFESRISRREVDSDLYALIDNKKYNVNEKGIDELEFYISTNKGEELGPLKEIVSGGELSRIMLSIKSIIAGKDGVETIVFDEADTGISGRIAEKTAKFMKNLSNNTQIIAISHLPQIAANADSHIIVEKFEDDEGVFSKARTLKEDERHLEIAKLFSGEELTDSALKSAKQLIGN